MEKGIYEFSSYSYYILKHQEIDLMKFLSLIYASFRFLKSIEKIYVTSFTVMQIFLNNYCKL